MMANALAGRPVAMGDDPDEQKAWQEGLAMPMEDAIRYALQPDSAG